MKKFIAAAVAIVMVFTFCVPFIQDARAEGLTSSIIAGATYSLMQYWGISTTAGAATGAGMDVWMSNQVDNYVDYSGSTIEQLFGDGIRIVAGQLAIAQYAYNGIRNFVDWLIDEFGLTSSDTVLTDGQLDGLWFPTGEIPGDESVHVAGLSVIFLNEGTPSQDKPYNWGFGKREVYLDSDRRISSNVANPYMYDGTYFVTYHPREGLIQPSLKVHCQKHDKYTGEAGEDSVSNIGLGDQDVTDRLSWNGENYVEPTVLNPTESWVGTLEGEDWQDIDIEDAMEDVFNHVADNDISIDGEVIDEPLPPEPTVVPQPTHAPVDDVIDGLNDLIEQQDTVIEGINDLVEGTDAIEDAIEDVKTEVGEIAETLEEATEVIEPEAAADYKFDLRNLFPFCIPFDIVRILGLFDVSPVAPHVQLPFVIDSLNFSYTFDLDFSAFNSVAAIMRGLEFIVFAIGLAIVTSKVIRW